jgi:hypothetical protein
MWNKMLNRDHYFLGIAIGMILPLVFYLLLWLMDMAVVAWLGKHMLREEEYLLLLSIAVNLFPIKYYFVNLQFDKTGRGILLMTFLETMLYFIVT